MKARLNMLVNKSKEQELDFQETQLEEDQCQLGQIIGFQYIFKIFGYLIQMFLLCWLLGLVFYCIIYHLHGGHDIDPNVKYEDCDGADDFFSFGFKDEDRCFKELEWYQ